MLDVQLTERGQKALQRLAGFHSMSGQWAAGSRPGTSERHLSRTTSASSAPVHANTLYAGHGSGTPFFNSSSMYVSPFKAGMFSASTRAPLCSLITSSATSRRADGSGCCLVGKPESYNVHVQRQIAGAAARHRGGWRDGRCPLPFCRSRKPRPGEMPIASALEIGLHLFHSLSEPCSLQMCLNIHCVCTGWYCMTT